MRDEGRKLKLKQYTAWHCLVLHKRTAHAVPKPVHQLIVGSTLEAPRSRFYPYFCEKNAF
jgi:hypothetical protein